jgi:environmental stress-induced protein Ves
MAHIASDGPFSSFPAVDRTLTIIEGTGLHLVIDGRSVDLTEQSEPFSFRGESETYATRIGSTLTDLNVMTRRDCFTHRVTRMAPDDELVVARDVTVALLFCTRGRMRVESTRRGEDLSTHDSVMVREPLSLSGDPSAAALLVEILPSPAGRS